MKRLSNTVAAKMNDSEEDTDSELEEEQDIRKYKSYFNCGNFSLISITEGKHGHLLNIFVRVLFCHFTVNNEFCGDLPKE